MKPATLAISTLLAGAIAGVAPQVSTPFKTALAPGATVPGAGDPQQGSEIQLAWPTSSKVVMLQRDGDRYIGYLPVRNTSGDSQCFSIDPDANAFDGSRVALASGARQPLRLKAFATNVQKLELAGDAHPRNAFFRIYKSVDSSPEAEPCKLAKVPAFSDLEIRINEDPLAGRLFIGALLMVSAVLTITVVNLFRKGISITNVMGKVSWTFEKSWGANVTLGSALLVTLVGLTLFPERPVLMAKSSYTLLQILFGALVSLAPVVYNLIQREVQVDNGGIPGVSVQGYVGMFLLSGGLVLWAALGQLATLGILAEEFVLSGNVDLVTGRTLQGLAGMLFLLLLIYAFKSLSRTPQEISATPQATAWKQPGPLPPSVASGLPLPASEWSVL